MKKLQVFITACACSVLLAMAPQPVVDKAPAFVLDDLDGKPVASSKFAGQVVLLNFWATWCPPCLAEIPALNSLHNKYKSRGFAVVGISVDEDGPAAVKAFAEQRGIDYPILMSSDEVIAAYGGIRGIPTTFLIGRDGKIVKRYIGEQSEKKLEDAITALL